MVPTLETLEYVETNVRSRLRTASPGRESTLSLCNIQHHLTKKRFDNNVVINPQLLS